MVDAIERARDDSRRTRRWSWVLLGLGALLSSVVWQRAAEREQVRADEVFRQQAQAGRDALAGQLDHYLDRLAGFQALFMANNELGRPVFHAQHRALRAANDYPGLIAVQFAALVPHAQKSAFEARVAADRSVDAGGYPGFRINPPGDRPFYVATVYNEPLRGNEAVMGYDTAFEAARRAVLEPARDSGRPQASPPLQLLQLRDADKTGFVVRLPVYRGQDVPTTVAERQARYLGQISGVLRASDLMRPALQRREWGQLGWRVRDVGLAGAAPQPPQVLFDSTTSAGAALAHARPADRLQQHLTVAGRQWQIEVTRPRLDHALQPYPLALLAGGLLGSLGLWWAVFSGAGRHGRAVRIAEDLSRQARDSEAHLRAVLDHTVDGIVTLDADGTLMSVNHAACSIFGYRETDLVGRHLSALVPSASIANGMDASLSFEDFLATQRLGADGVGRRTEGCRRNGQMFPLDMAMGTMSHGGVTQYTAVLRDLSAERAAEQAILEAHRQLNEIDEMRRVIVHNAPYAILVLNRVGVIQTVNPAGEALLGYRAQDLVGRATTQRFFDPEQVRERAHLLALRLNQPAQEMDVLAHLAGESPGLPSEWNLVRADGRSLVAEISVTVLTNENGHVSGYLAMAQDVTSRRDAENQLQHLALHDSLTALPNRNMLQEQLKASLHLAERDGHAMALMFIDLDRFKKINDTLGHHIGDTVLIEVARRLRSSMRTSDIVARLGGDEFVILLPRIAEEADGERVAQKVIDQFSEPLRIGPHELRVTPSIGLVLHPRHGTDAITLMRHADLAMYRAKNLGRNRIQVYSDDMESPAVDTLALENDLYKALERDELRLHFQPQFDCATGQITGAEALLRWEHGGRLVPPSDFIPLAEETGLIVEFGDWVLRRACRMAQAWRTHSGWPLRVAVNLSAVQLDQADIARRVATVLNETGLPATALELEITESVVVRESLRAADILTELRALGVSVAIDDFGVGYSSFAYLRELPVDRFKLDRSFLSAVPQSDGDSRLTAALIAMAHRLEVGIVAEGVETAEQMDFLRDHGCDEAQGYHLGRPMNEDAFEALLMEHSRLHSDLVHRPVTAPATA